ncbi:MAG: hypothetical protein ABIT36_12740 [Steroidobacteraceae bacterium]
MRQRRVENRRRNEQRVVGWDPQLRGEFPRAALRDAGCARISATVNRGRPKGGLFFDMMMQSIVAILFDGCYAQTRWHIIMRTGNSRRLLSPCRCVAAGIHGRRQVVLRLSCRVPRPLSTSQFLSQNVWRRQSGNSSENQQACGDDQFTVGEGWSASIPACTESCDHVLRALPQECTGTQCNNQFCMRKNQCQRLLSLA